MRRRKTKWMRSATERTVANHFRYPKRILMVALLSIPTAAALWVFWSLVAYRDIPVTVLEERYGAPELARLEVDGVPLRYRVDGTGPALVLIHSLYFDMRMWNAWAPALSKRFRVIRFDLTGHGLTGPEPSGDYSLDRDLELIEELLDRLDVHRFAVAGSSLGGALAFNLAARHPNRVTELVLINASGIPRSDPRRAAGGIPGWVDHLLYLVPTLAFQAFLEWLIVDDRLVTTDLAVGFHETLRRQGNRTALLDRLRAFRETDPADALARIRAPVLILWGADNPQLPVTLVGAFEALLANAAGVRSIVYPGVGHVIPLEVPAQGVADLLAFLPPPEAS